MSAGPLPTFGLGTNQRTNATDINKDDAAGGYSQMGHDPSRMYPPDPPGEETGENGRVWKIYRDRVGDIDDELLQGWNDALNTLLVFAGLFSAACTAFLIEVSKSLQPDWQRATSLAVFAIYVHLNSTGSPPFEVPNPLLFSPPLDARWMNGLWFTSLTLSLVVSLLAILVKQWLNEFKSRMRKPASSPKAWALRHSFFKNGLERWGVDAMISILPLLLHASLFLFLIGLCLMLFPLDDHMAGAVIGISGAVSVFYVAAGIAPVFWSDCPSATPALRYAFSLWNYVVFPVADATCTFLFEVVFLFLVFLIIWLFDLLCSWCCAPCEPITRSDWSSWASDIIPKYRRGTAKPKFDQANIFAKAQPLREASVLEWMIRMLPAQNDVVRALCAVSCLSAETCFQQGKENNPLFNDDMQRVAKDTLESVITRNVGGRIDDETIAGLLRAFIVVSTTVPRLSDQARRLLSEAANRNTPELERLFKFAARGFGPIDYYWLRRSGLAAPESRAWKGIRFAIMASDISRPSFLPSAVAAFNSYFHSPSHPDSTILNDPRLRFIATSDKLLYLIHDDDGDTEGCDSFIMSACSAAARDFLSDPKAISPPPNFQEQLRFISTGKFLRCDLSAADLNAIATLLCQPGSHIPTLALHHILYHFQRGQLPIGGDELTWIQAVFQPPPVTLNLMDTLGEWPFADDALHASRLSMLGPVQFTKQTIWEREVINYPSLWSVLLTIVSMPDSTENLAELACAYTVLLLALYRYGHVEPARDMLRELLPRKRRASIIAYGTGARYHLALHVKIIDSSWWGELRDELASCGEWTSHPPHVHSDVSSFIEAVEAPNDCLQCVPADVGGL